MRGVYFANYRLKTNSTSKTYENVVQYICCALMLVHNITVDCGNSRILEKKINE